MDVDWNSPVKTEDTPDPLSRLDIDGEIHKSTSSQPLAILPAPLELLILAARYVDAAHGLTPAIARGPGASDSNAAAASAEHRDEYQQALLIYRRHMSAAIACCSYAAKSSGQDPRLAIRAHLMLAELLVNETRNAERAEQVISRGVSTFFSAYSE